jgi:hypothetical protein
MRVLVVIRSARGLRRVVRRADRHGRLTVAVPLGPGNAADEYSPAAKAADAITQAQDTGGRTVAGSPGTVVYRTTVELAPVRGRPGRRRRAMRTR